MVNVTDSTPVPSVLSYPEFFHSYQPIGTDCTEYIIYMLFDKRIRRGEGIKLHSREHRYEIFIQSNITRASA